MLNLLGDCWLNTGQLREPRWDQVLAIPGAHLHLYGKQEARPGRKMGHINFVAPSASEALARLQQAARLLGIDVGM